MKISEKTIAYLLVLILLTFTSCNTLPAKEQSLSPSAANISPSSTVEEPTASSLPEDNVEAAIKKVFEDRLLAIKTKDYDLYMSAIGQNNQFFYNEQERWFMNMTDESISDVSFEVLSVEKLDSDNCIATVRQKHKTNEAFDFEYELIFKLEDDKWMDYGYNFEEYKTDKFIVKYTKQEKKLEDFTQMLNDAFNNLDKIYELKPLNDYEMKLFADQEMLRQRSIPANLWLFTGWSEPDESLKMYTGHNIEYNSYAGVVQHELVHHITIRICNNNLPIWILEGIAMYDGTAFYGIESSLLLSNIAKENVSLTIDYLEKNDLTSDLERQEIYNFYNTSYMYVRYICETYGRKTLMDIFYKAGEKPFHDSTLNDTFEYKNQETAGDVIKTILGITKEQLSSDYLTWLDNLTEDEIKSIKSDNVTNNAELSTDENKADALIIIGNEFGNTYFEMKTALQDRGFNVTTVGVGARELYSSCPNHEKQEVVADIDISEITEANISNYSLVFVPAGKHFRSLPSSKDFARVMNLCKDSEIYISSVCAGNIALAGIDGFIKDHNIAASSVTSSSIENSEGICKYSSVVVDGYFVTGDKGGGKSGSSYNGAPIEELADKLKDLVYG